MSNPEYVRVDKAQLDRLLQENKELKADIAIFIKDGPGHIFEFLGDKNKRPIVALGKAMKEFMKNPETFKKSGEIGSYFISKYKGLVELLIPVQEAPEIAQITETTDTDND